MNEVACHFIHRPLRSHRKGSVHFQRFFDSRHAVYRCLGEKLIPMSKDHEKTASKKRFSCLFAAEFSLQPREDTIVFLGFNLIEFRDEIFLLLI